jgi:hypothetical protein
VAVLSLSSSFCNLNQKVIDQQPDKNLGVFFGKILFFDLHQIIKKQFVFKIPSILISL